MERVVFYFSFRSPYAWMAYHRIVRAGTSLPVEFERIPVFPPPDFPNDPAAVPAKLDYILHDVGRIAAAYGLPVRWPASRDTDWMRPHAAWIHAADAGQGDSFALALYGARFSEGRNVGDDEVLRDAARVARLDPAAIIRAAADPVLHERVLAGMMRGLGDGIFGVPFFVYRGERFWGNDRVEWLLRAVATNAGTPVPDLASDVLARPH
jgi:2-hydroxychromene-2-carboxylate isomerase